MADNKVLKGINFPGLEGTYYVPEAKAVKDENGYIEIQSYVSDTVEVENLDATLTKRGYAADAKAVGEALSTKAPSGFGLGSTSVGVVSLADIDGSLSALIPTGWYRLVDNLGVGITIDGVQFNPAQMRIESDSFSGQMSITLFRNSAPTIRRSFIRGFWEPWEWINPPMEAGVEYRTTQRWNGKPLYKKLVSLGSVSNGASIEWHDKTNVIPIRYDAHFYAQTVPKYNSASSYLFVHLAANIAAISCAGYTNSPVTITIDYVYSE